MDDQPVSEGTEGRSRSRGLGPAASLVAAGLLVGLAVGWIAWRGASARDTGPVVTIGSDGDAPNEYVEGVSVANDPVQGPDGAPITIVEFSDFECPFCARFARNTAPRLRAQYGDRIRWIFINYPLESIHPRAYDAALAGECVHTRGDFWKFYEAMFEGEHDLSRSSMADVAESIGIDREAFETCLEDAEHAPEVAADIREGRKFYILGTPMFFVNGVRLEGAQPAEVFASVIDSILAGS